MGLYETGSMIKVQGGSFTGRRMTCVASPRQVLISTLANFVDASDIRPAATALNCLQGSDSEGGTLT